MRQRIFWTIFIVCFGWVLLGLLTSFLFFTSYYEKEIISHLKQNSHYIEVGLKQQGISYLSSINTTYRISIIDSLGNVVYDNLAPLNSLDNHVDRIEFKESIKHGMAQSYRYSGSMQHEMLYYALKIMLPTTFMDVNNDILDTKDMQTYVLRIASPHKNIFLLLCDTLPYISLILFACLIVSFILARSIAHFITSPLNALRLENPLGIKSYEELLPLLHKVDEQNRLIDVQIKQLQVDKDTFNTITQNMDDGFLLLDSKGDILSFNKSSMKFFGVLHEGMNIVVLDTHYKKWFEIAMQGSKHTEVIEHNDCTYQVIVESVFNSAKPHDDDMDSNHDAKFDRSQDSESLDSILTTCITESKMQNSNLDSTKSIRNSAVPIGVAIILLDITEKAQREQLRREFSANVSHELKTPLTSILAVLEMLQNNIIKQEDIPKFLGNMHKEAKRLMALIEDIIILNELDNDYTFTPFSLSMQNLCEIVLAMFKDSIAQKHLHCTIRGDDFLVMGEQRLLLAMLSHLCENAIKYNKDKGNIELTLNATHKTLCIKDSGIGIPEMYHERVFERFFCVDKSHSNMINGTGLGLSIVKHVAHLHNARIELKSTLDVGTTITLWFD
ncbi:MAG: ATP-binding protein [Helicobacter trogontum]|uniref:sensor histidine kinase n=1 Tax=Helicobacter trogontum TaxID=50960 RepID=UPI00242CFA63|nr:ATP-binding protein [Helicobacter trogontum]MCI5786524.1 ATP-binding protein [Helicobacter trogontum]